MFIEQPATEGDVRSRAIRRPRGSPTGAVRSRAERDAVIGATKGTRGVEIVIDQLDVDPSISG